MKKIYLICFFLLYIFFSNAQTPCEPSVIFTGGSICPTDNWKLVFHDEFSGNSIDQTKWATYGQDGSGTDQWEFSRTHGNEGQIYKDANVVVSNGTLKLIAKHETTTWYSATRNYTSGFIESRLNYQFMYGKFEIRCKLPLGEGFWPAFWTFGGNGTEIDIFEAGGQSPNDIHFNVRKWITGGVVIDDRGYSYNGPDFSQDFHIFSAEWDPWFITFKVDGIEAFKVNRFTYINGIDVSSCYVPFGTYLLRPYFPCGLINNVKVIANLAIGTSSTPFTGAPSASTVFPNQMEIDYIRVYQRNPQQGYSDLCQNLISGPKNICEYTHGNIYSYDFIGTPSNISLSSNLTVWNMFHDKIEVFANSGSSGPAWIRVDYPSNEACGQISSTKTIWIGAPSIPIVTLRTLKCNPCFNAVAHCDPNSMAIYQWNIDNGRYQTDDCAMSVPFRLPYVVTATNSCGSVTKRGYLTSEKCDGGGIKWIIISPNPVKDFITIELKDINKEDIEMLLLVCNKTSYFQKLDTPELQLKLDVTSLKNGVYYVILKMKNVEEAISESFLIQH